MRKSLLTLGAAAIALSGMAATPKHLKNTSVPMASEKFGNVKVNRDAAISGVAFKKAPAKINTAEDVITSVEGTKQMVSLKGSGYLEFFGGIYYYLDDTTASHIVYGDNNEVYFFNLVPNAITDTYVKGIKDGDKIVVELPQTVLYWPADEDYPEEAMNLAMYAYDEEEEWYVPADDSSITFSVKEDGSMVAEGINEDKILAYGYSSGEWSGYGTWDLTITPFNDQPVVLPDDFEATENFWIIQQDGFGQFANFAQGGEELYFQGLFEDIPEAWMKASIEYEDYTATVSIPQNQYLGLYNDSYFMYVKCAKMVGEDDYGYPVFEAMPEDYQYQLVWDFEEMTLKAKEPEVFLILNYNDGDIDAKNAISDVSMIHQDSYEGTPVNPCDLEYSYSEYDECYAFVFVIPAMSTDGDFLMTSDLSYVVYVDGEEWEFDADEYFIPESLVEIPWNFSEYYIYDWGGCVREVDFFVEGISTLGVQSIYRYDGEETRSEIVTIDLEGDPDAVGTVNSGKKVVSVKYYGLDGREVANPSAGIFVKRVTFEDGTIATFKKAVR